MTQQRLCDLAQISIERSTTDKIGSTKLLKEFPNAKARKKTFYQNVILNSFFHLTKELPTCAELF